MDKRLIATSGGLVDRTVPCDGCRLCCRNDALRLLPGDDASRYKTEPHPRGNGELMLAHKRNGDCIYLGEHGCTIHKDRPLMCREMDCRLVATAITYTNARKLAKRGALPMPVWRKGKELLRSCR